MLQPLFGLACTPKGEALGQSVRRTMADHEAELYSALTQNEQEQLLDLLIKMRRSVTAAS